MDVSKPLRPKVLIASYPRTGSTTFERVARALAGQRAVVLHEPFRAQWGEDARAFNEQLDEVVASTDVLKHHPGNVASVRQNRLLYGAWLSAGGVIVHLHRKDLWAQATSLAIARGLNSFHRPHRVTQVPASRIGPEFIELHRERELQRRVLAAFPHTELAYEDIGAGPLRWRIRLALEAIAPGMAFDKLDDATQREVSSALSSKQRVRSNDSSGAITGGRNEVALVDQVPLHVGAQWHFTAAECEALERDVLAEADPILSRRHGVVACQLGDEKGSHVARELLTRVGQAIAERSRVATTAQSCQSCIEVSAYDGDRHADHDLLLTEATATKPITMDFSVALSDPEHYQGGSLHVGGRGEQPRSRERGVVCYAVSQLGARRQPVLAGRAAFLVGTLEIAPGQILCGAQMPWSPPMFLDETEP